MQANNPTLGFVRGLKCGKSVAILAVLCVVLGGCSDSSDQTDATVSPVETATTAGMADASTENTVASSGEAEVVDSARTSPSSVPSVPSADDSEEADFPDRTPSTSVIPSTTTTVSSSTIDSESTKDWEEELAEVIEIASAGKASDEEVAIQQPAEPDEAPAEETGEEADTGDECPTPEIDASETASDSVLTDVIHGVIIRSEDGEPLGLDFVYVETYPGFWPPFDVYYAFEILNVLNIELRDTMGVTVYCAPFSIRPSSNDNFWVRVPNPPDYDRIAIVNSGEDIGEIWRSTHTPTVEDLAPEHGSIFCYNDVIKGVERIRLRWKNVDKDYYTLSRSSFFYREFANHVWISTDGDSDYKLIGRGQGNVTRYTFDPADFYDVRDVYVRVHISDSTRTSYSETYFKFDPSACLSEQKRTAELEAQTAPEKQDREISKETECNLPGFSTESDQNEDRLEHTIDARVRLSYQNDPIGLSSFQVEVLTIPSSPSEPSAGGRHLRGTIELRDVSGQAVDSYQYIVFWPSKDYFPWGGYGDIYARTPPNSGYFVSSAIPDPADYESIAILYAGEEIGVFHKSENSPVVEIVSPHCGKAYQSDDTIRITWYGYDLDGDDLDYEVWYSTDERESYRRTYLNDDYTFDSNRWEDFSGRVYVRVHVTDGILTDYDEIYFEISESETSEEAQE